MVLSCRIDYSMTLFLSTFQWILCHLLFRIDDVFMSLTSWYGDALRNWWRFLTEIHLPFHLTTPKSIDLSLYGWCAFVVIIIRLMGPKLPLLLLLLLLGAPFLLCTNHSLMMSCLHFSPSYPLASFSSRSPQCFLGFAPPTWCLWLLSAFKNAPFFLEYAIEFAARVYSWGIPLFRYLWLLFSTGNCSCLIFSESCFKR